MRVLAVTSKSEVLLVRHTCRAGGHLPGRGVERGDTAAEAAARDLAEEGGLRAAAPPRLLGVCRRRVWPAGDQAALFEVSAWTPWAPRANGEFAAAEFFPLDALPADVDPSTAAKLREYRAGDLTDRW